MSSRALELLTKTAFNDGLRAGVPENIEVAHKFGERILPNNIQQLHDCGIVYIPNKPYLLCIMTRGKDMHTLQGVIEEISSSVYAEVNPQFKN